MTTIADLRAENALLRDLVAAVAEVVLVPRAARWEDRPKQAEAQHTVAIRVATICRDYAGHSYAAATLRQLCPKDIDYEPAPDELPFPASGA